MSEPEKSAELVGTRARILDAAEHEFAASGFDGTGMKAIATRAGVAQGLLHYYFTNKERLYAAVIERRSTLINAARLSLLTDVDGDSPDVLEQIFHAFLAPPLGPEGGGADYARIFAGLGIGLERDRVLVRQCYDETAQRFIDALIAALPGARREDAAWAYTLALGSLVAVVGRDQRLERLSGGETSLDDLDEVISRLTRFAASGFRDMVDRENARERERTGIAQQGTKKGEKR